MGVDWDILVSIREESVGVLDDAPSRSGSRSCFACSALAIVSSIPAELVCQRV